VAVALAFVLVPLLRRRGERRSGSSTPTRSEIYQQELEELEGEAARGELPPDAAREQRDELRRRLVEGRASPAPVDAPRRRTRAFALIVALAVPIAAAVLYVTVGRPEALDEQHAEETSAEGDQVAQLQSHLARQPRDARGWVLLARAQSERGEFAASADAYQKAITVSEKVAKDPGVLCEYADVLGMTQGGKLAGKPSELIAQALGINPKHPMALEMAGSAAYDDGRYGDAARYWKELLAGVSPGSERYSQLSAAISRAERKAAVSLPR
jgi:cytochrome c-type biogenesis protein CcmH